MITKLTSKIAWIEKRSSSWRAWLGADMEHQDVTQDRKIQGEGVRAVYELLLQYE